MAETTTQPASTSLETNQNQPPKPQNSYDIITLLLILKDFMKSNSTHPNNLSLDENSDRLRHNSSNLSLSDATSSVGHDLNSNYHNSTSLHTTPDSKRRNYDINFNKYSYEAEITLLKEKLFKIKNELSLSQEQLISMIKQKLKYQLDSEAWQEDMEIMVAENIKLQCQNVTSFDNLSRCMSSNLSINGDNTTNSHSLSTPNTLQRNADTLSLQSSHLSNFYNATSPSHPPSHSTPQHSQTHKNVTRIPNSLYTPQQTANRSQHEYRMRLGSWLRGKISSLY